MPPFTAFIGNLSFEPDVEDEVRAFFNDLDPVSVRIVKDPQGKPKGFGYAEFKTQDGLKQALDRSMSQLQGRTIRVNVAEARKHYSFLFLPYLEMSPDMLFSFHFSSPPFRRRGSQPVATIYSSRLSRIFFPTFPPHWRPLRANC